MTEQSRLEAAKRATEAGGEWYRSPLVLLAGLILFVGALAVVVFAVTGGGDDAATAATVNVAPDTAEADSVVAEAAPATNPAAEQAEDIAAPPPVFGGDAIAEIGVVTVTGEPLPKFDPAGDDPAIGLAAPVVRTTSLGNGAEITLEPGTARVIGFFAHWCPHCQRELPEVAAWLAENGLPANTQVIAVSTAVNAERDNYPPSAWFTREGWGAPVIVDDADGTLLGAYGFTGFPAFVAIDATGIVVERAAGNIGAAGFAALFENFATATQS